MESYGQTPQKTKNNGEREKRDKFLSTFNKASDLYIYVYIYIYREREREREIDR